MRIAVLGAGSLGSLLAGLLSRTEDVLLVGRPGPHLSTVESAGLTVEGNDTTVRTSPRVSTDHADVSGADLVIIAVKSYDTASAMRDLQPHLDDEAILTLQNGLGNVETIIDAHPQSAILAGSTTVGANLTAPGRVVQSGDGETKIGWVDGEPDDFVETVATRFEENGIETSVISDVERAIWEKVIINVGINAATALARVRNGRLVSEPAGERLLERAVSEAEATAREEGIDVSSDLTEQANAVASSTAANRSSMLQDLEAAHVTEIGALNEAIVERAEANDCEAPVNRTLTDCVRLAESAFSSGE
ncbi:MAG: ketopantoate reductase family protein [Halodesulfurarchaeum sp.]